jgi:PRTase ComF-like
VPATIPSYQFSVYQLDENGSATDLTCPQPFNVALYSRYKYGSTVAADWFARALGSSFLAQQPSFACWPRLLIASSPYHYVPTAAHALTIRLVAMLNDARAGHGLPAARLVHIERGAASSGDYGTLSADARTRLMTANALSFGRLLPYADNAHLIVVDDVKVTGAHQECLIRASDALPLRARMFLHIAAFIDSGARPLDPALEDRLNHAAIRTLDDLAPVVAGPDFSWNVRVCKFLLNPANQHRLAEFLARMPVRRVRELHDNSLRDGYARMDAYRGSHAIVRAELRQRERSLAGASAASRPTAQALD